jgi:hypothetical protein
MPREHTEVTPMQGTIPPGVDLELLRRFYSMQWEQRWRGSRNQDWGLIGLVATIAAAAVAIQYASLEPQHGWLKAFFPLLVVVSSIVGLRILWLHQVVMNHASYVAKGIERALQIAETGSDAPVPPGDELFVGFDGEGFKYPSKAAYSRRKPVHPLWFFAASHVQACIAYFHLVFLVGFLAVFLARALGG